MRTSQLHTFSTYEQAQRRHSDLERLNRRPFSIFNTADGLWAFWTP